MFTSTAAQLRLLSAALERTQCQQNQLDNSRKKQSSSVATRTAVLSHRGRARGSQSMPRATQRGHAPLPQRQVPAPQHRKQQEQVTGWSSAATAARTKPQRSEPPISPRSERIPRGGMTAPGRGINARRIQGTTVLNGGGGGGRARGMGGLRRWRQQDSSRRSRKAMAARGCISC
jgi:hypothetical protein